MGIGDEDGCMDEDDSRDEGEDIISCHSLCLLGCSFYIHSSWFNQVNVTRVKNEFLFLWSMLGFLGVIIWHVNNKTRRRPTCLKHQSLSTSIFPPRKKEKKMRLDKFHWIVKFKSVLLYFARNAVGWVVRSVHGVEFAPITYLTFYVKSFVS